MSEKEKTAEEELRDKTWQIAGRIVICAFLIGVGYMGGFFQYGDATELRHQVKVQQDRIVSLENERETMNTRMAKETRDREVCSKDLKATKDALQKAQAAAAAPAPTPQ
jgi:cell division protein FtsB